MNEVNGFLKAEGRKIVNEFGEEVLLRGVGLGGWLLPEGYMWRFPNKGDRPRRIENMIRSLIGNEKFETFWELYRSRYTTEEDVRQIAAEGFNSIRLPINARIIMEDGETLKLKEKNMCYIDNVIAWCRKYNIYVILDLHGAPGGQTGTNIDDSEFDKPELFTNEKNWNLSIALWKTLAERYKDEWIIAGYDLLNEPLPNWNAQYNDRMMPLYKDMVKAIREVDKKHMIILEGVHWATDWSIFNEKIDDNLMLQFHKYWSNVDTESIQVYLDKRDEWNVPIFMGEGGENNKDWYAGAFSMYEEHDISWNFWTWKKMNTDNSPCSVKMPEGWNELVNYLENGIEPDEKTAERILWEYLDNILIDNCIYHSDVVRSLFRRPSVRIPAVYYGYSGAGVSFGISKSSKNNTGLRVNDGVNIRNMNEIDESEPVNKDEKLFVQLAEDDWLSYKFTVESSSKTNDFSINLRTYIPEGIAQLMITIDEKTICSLKVDNKLWNTLTLSESLKLASGTHNIVLQAKENPICLEWIEVISIQ